MVDFFKKLLFGSPEIQQFTVPFGTVKTQAARFAKPVFSALGKAIKFVSPKTLKGTVIAAATIPATVGLATTPFGREAISTVFSPIKGFRRGQATPEFVGGVVEEVKKGTQKPTDIKSALKTAGIVGAGAALAGATVIAGKKVIEKFREEDLLITGAPAATLQPLAPVKQPVEEEAVIAEPMAMPTPINIKNTFKPTVSVSVKQTKSKKFINQQLLIKR